MPAHSINVSWLVILSPVVLCMLRCSVAGVTAGKEARDRQKEIGRLLERVENTQSPPHERAAAVKRLGELQATEAIDRLGKLLPGDYDVLTGTIVVALGRIGSSRALPYLYKVDDGTVQLSGKLSTVLYFALENIEGPSPDQVQAHLKEVEDKKVPLDWRLFALECLRSKKALRKAIGVEERLLKMLPGDYDRLTLEIVRTIGEIGSPKAIPILQKMLLRPGGVPQKLGEAIQRAIENCQKT